MTVNMDREKKPKKTERVYLKCASFNLNILLITLNHPGNSDNEDLESCWLKKMFKWEVQNRATALFYMSQCLHFAENKRY